MRSLISCIHSLVVIKAHRQASYCWLKGDMWAFVAGRVHGVQSLFVKASSRSGEHIWFVLLAGSDGRLRESVSGRRAVALGEAYAYCLCRHVSLRITHHRLPGNHPSVLAAHNLAWRTRVIPITRMSGNRPSLAADGLWSSPHAPRAAVHCRRAAVSVV